ncbi:MAG: hypothetical protein EHM61_08040 [Acidobacteria bacterium]|nr:MAG: hypothetical protein EHM61_08040 [Acidobacteriota bacterium]
MFPKPRLLDVVGIVQFVLAAFFVVWLFTPGGGSSFAWPVQSALTAGFLGTAFILRAALGLAMWHEKSWHHLRWVVWGNYTFLGLIFLGTFWHLDEMSWKTQGLLAHVWVIAYIVEPLLLVLREPRDPLTKAALSPEHSGGPLFPGLRLTLTGIYMVGFTVAGILFIHPEFADTRWPWPLDPFDARIMSAWPAACAVWAATMYLARDWAEVKLGVQLLLIHGTSLFVFWAVTFPSYDPARNNRWPFGAVVGIAAVLLAYYYWRQEAARRKAAAPLASRAPVEGRIMGPSPS